MFCGSGFCARQSSTYFCSGIRTALGSVDGSRGGTGVAGSAGAAAGAIAVAGPGMLMPGRTIIPRDGPPSCTLPGTGVGSRGSALPPEIAAAATGGIDGGGVGATLDGTVPSSSSARLLPLAKSALSSAASRRIVPISPRLSPIALRPSPKVDGAFLRCASIASAMRCRSSLDTPVPLPAPGKKKLAFWNRSLITRPSGCCPSRDVYRSPYGHRHCGRRHGRSSRHPAPSARRDAGWPGRSCTRIRRPAASRARRLR